VLKECIEVVKEFPVMNSTSGTVTQNYQTEMLSLVNL
jgi:hypothetical protein